MSNHEYLEYLVVGVIDDKVRAYSNDEKSNAPAEWHGLGLPEMLSRAGAEGWQLVALHVGRNWTPYIFSRSQT